VKKLVKRIKKERGREIIKVREREKRWRQDGKDNGD
jgi:hypothetical protein